MGHHGFILTQSNVRHKKKREGWGNSYLMELGFSFPKPVFYVLFPPRPDNQRFRTWT